MSRRFRGEHRHKLDDKGRVSIPADFRRVLAHGDPEATETRAPELVIVFGGDTQNFLECYTMRAIDEVDTQIEMLPRASKERRALELLYHTRALPTAIDDTGRLVLPIKLRNKIGAGKELMFVGRGQTFEIWTPGAWEEQLDAEVDNTIDPRSYLPQPGTALSAKPEPEA